MRTFDLNRDAADAVRTIAVIVVLILIVVLIRRGTVWYMATLMGFGVMALLATLAFLIDLPSRKPKP